jgi:hypothetical protein
LTGGKRARMCEQLGLEELEHLHLMLSSEARDELLQCLLIAAPGGGEAMIKVLEAALLCHATEDLLGGALEGGESDA